MSYMQSYKQSVLAFLYLLCGGNAVMQSNVGYEKIILEKKEFRVGDIVQWEKPINKKWRLLIAGYKREYGKGPFVIRKVKNIPRNKETGDLRKSVGHHQFVWLENTDDRFSGALFRILKKRK